MYCADIIYSSKLAVFRTLGIPIANCSNRKESCKDAVAKGFNLESVVLLTDIFLRGKFVCSIQNLFL